MTLARFHQQLVCCYKGLTFKPHSWPLSADLQHACPAFGVTRTFDSIGVPGNA